MSKEIKDEKLTKIIGGHSLHNTSGWNSISECTRETCSYLLYGKCDFKFCFSAPPKDQNELPCGKVFKN